MQKQFHVQFKKLFKGAKQTLENALNQKFKAITRIDDPSQILNEKEYKAKKLGYVYNANASLNADNEQEKKIEIPLLFYKGTKTIKQL